MLDIDYAKSLDQSIDRLGDIIQRLEVRQNGIERRFNMLYQTAAVALTIIVLSITLLVVVLSLQLPQMTTAMLEMNDKFSSVSKNMARMDRVIDEINSDMQSLPQIIGHVDRVNSSLLTMNGGVSMIGEDMVRIDNSIGGITLSVTDMRNSFYYMEGNVGGMGRDVNNLSQPMRIFNRMNPFN